MKKVEQASWAAVAAGILLNLLATIFSIQADRPLAVDGSWWAFRILEQKKTSFGANQLRYLSAAFEYPALLLSKWKSAEDHTVLIVRVWETGLVIHPYLSLLLCLWILKRAGKVRLFPIVALSLGLCSQIALAFAANQSAEVLTVFWPTLCLLACHDPRKRATLLGVLAGSALFCITHESSLIAFGMLLWVAWRRKAPRYYHVLFALGGAECVARSIFGFYPTGTSLGRALPFVASWFPWHCAIIAGLIGLRVWSPKSRRGAAFERKGQLALAALCLLLAWVAPTPPIGTLFYGRLLVVILGCCLGGYFWLMSGRSAPTSSRFQLSLNLLVAAALVYAAKVDVHASLDWEAGVKEVASIENALGPGCHLIPRTKFASTLWIHGLKDVYMPTLSLVLQKRKRIEYVLFTEHQWAHSRPEEVCPAFESKGMMSFFDDQKILPLRYFIIPWINSPS